jgi:hypothetical protein
VLHSLDVGDAAGTLDRTYVDPKDALTATRLDECGSLRLPDRGIGSNCDLNALLPFLCVPLGCRRVAFYLADFVTDIGYARSLLAD